MRFSVVFVWSNSGLWDYVSLLIVPVVIYWFGWLLPFGTEPGKSTKFSVVMQLSCWVYPICYVGPLISAYGNSRLPSWVFPTMLVGSLISTFPSYLVGMAVKKLLSKKKSKRVP